MVQTNGEILRDTVLIVKAWKDNLNFEGEIIDFCGLAITILVTKNFLKKESITDSLLLTVTEIINSLKLDCVCFKPVIPTDENLFSEHSLKQKQDIISHLISLKDSIEDARLSENEKIACDKLKAVFGIRFPSGTENITNQKFLKTKSPAVLNKDGRSA